MAVAGAALVVEAMAAAVVQALLLSLYQRQTIQEQLQDHPRSQRLAAIRFLNLRLQAPTPHKAHIMDTQTLINALFGIVLLGTGWFLNELWRAVKELRADLHDIEAELPKEYVLKVDLDKRMEHIETMFQRIYDKIDGKADK